MNRLHLTDFVESCDFAEQPRKTLNGSSVSAREHWTRQLQELVGKAPKAAPAPAATVPEPTQRLDSSLTFSEAELARACAAAAARARREALQAANADRQAHEARLLGVVARSLQELSADGSQRASTARAAVVQLTGAALDAVLLGPSGAMRCEAVANLLAHAMGELSSTSFPTIAVAPAEAVALRDLLSRAAMGPSSPAEVRIIEDNSLAVGQVRAGWQDGWAEIDLVAWRQAVIERLSALDMNSTDTNDRRDAGDR